MTKSLVEIFLDGEWVEFPEGLKLAAPGDIFRLRDRDDSTILPVGAYFIGQVGENLANGLPYLVALDYGVNAIDPEGDVCGGVKSSFCETIEEAIEESLQVLSNS